MDHTRIAELFQPFLGSSIDGQLTTSDLEGISKYIDLLLRWNTRINLTAIRDPEQIVTRHFGESLFAARHLFPNRGQGGTAMARAHRISSSHVPKSEDPLTDHLGTAALGCPAERSLAAISGGTDTLSTSEACRRAAVQGRAGGAEELRASAAVSTVADIGSGAGFPGIPMKLWVPEIALTLVESNQKKATFLREVARTLTLANVNIKSIRAETLNEKAFSLVTLRAVERFDAIVPVAIRMLAPGGRLALLISSAQIAQAQVLGRSLRWLDPVSIPQSASRVLLIAHYPE